MSTNNELDKSMQNAVDSYGEKIKTLKDFVTAVRKRPGMYIGDISIGLLTMIREIYQNSIDQLIESDSPCNWIRLTYDERTLEVTVEDNGLGLPFDDMVRILVTQHTSKNFEKDKGKFSSGLHGVGSKVVNALSNTFIAESYHYSGKTKKIVFNKGYSTKESIIENKLKKQGLKITFIPDLDIIGPQNLEWKTVYTLVKRILSLTPIGSTVDFEATDLNGNVFKENIVNKDGIITDLIMKCSSPINKPIIAYANDGERMVQCAFCFDSEYYTEVNVTSFANFCPTLQGTHITGCIDGITGWFVKYMNNIFLANQKSKDKTKVIPIDIRTSLCVMISAAHIEPIFTGQAKEILSNQDMLPFCKETITNTLDEWSKSNPQDLLKLSKFFKDIAEERIKSEKGREKIATKYTSNILTGMPAKFTAPLKENREVFIVEGDSAGGQAKDARLKNYQAVFPIRGKMPNAFQTPRAQFMSNAEVQAIMRFILKREYTRNFKVEDVEWEKIILMSDADIDGSHIASLLLRFFILYMPQLIEAGRLYRALPPLYAITKDKKNMYFTEQIDIVRYIQKYFSQMYTLSRVKGGNLTSKDLTVLFLTNEDYVTELESISATYSVTPELLEMVLFNKYNEKSPAVLKKQIKSTYRFMDITKHNGVDVIDGTIDKSYRLYLTDRLFDDCSKVMDIIKKNESTVYMLNGKEASLYEIMKKYDKCTPDGMQRYKGLGEMDVDELADSTMNPYANRTLLRYTLQDVKEEVDAIRQYESGLSNILDLVGNVKRRDLLD